MMLAVCFKQQMLYAIEHRAFQSNQIELKWLRFVYAVARWCDAQNVF